MKCKDMGFIVSDHWRLMRAVVIRFVVNNCLTAPPYISDLSVPHPTPSSLRSGAPGYSVLQILLQG